MHGIEAVNAACERALDSSDLRVLRARLASAGIGAAEAVRVLNTVHDAADQPAIASLKARLALDAADVSLERWLLLTAIQVHLPRVPTLPIPGPAKQLLLDEYSFMAAPDASSPRVFRYRHSRFAAMARMATLRRFPAGLFQWEESGIPRRYLLQVPWRDVPALAAVIACQLGGLAPLIVPHLNARRRTRWLLETSANRSYYLMAAAMEQQPRVRGILGVSWFRAPVTAKATPHLAWVNKVFLENGGFVTTVGPAGDDSGVFANSPHRRELFERGEFTPQLGMAVWPRDAVLAWKRAHPEFAPDGVRQGQRGAELAPGESGVPPAERIRSEARTVQVDGRRHV